jgi:hypothetical protein
MDPNVLYELAQLKEQDWMNEALRQRSIRAARAARTESGFSLRRVLFRPLRQRSSR